MKTIALFIISGMSFLGYSQNIYFSNSYGNNGYDYGRDIKQDVDTGYIATGSSSSFSSENADAFLLKIDSVGNFKWSYNYGGSGSDWGESVVVTHDSSYALAGFSNSSGSGGFDFYLVRTANDGVPLWEKYYGGSDWDKAYDLIQMPDSGFVMVGETYSYGNGNNDIYIVRTDKAGDTLWTRTFGGTEADYANAVVADGDSLVIAGGTESFGNGMSDGIVLKYHMDGTFGWFKTAGQTKEDYFTGITQHSDNNYYMSGTRDYHHHDGCDCGQDFWIYKMSTNGAEIVDTTFSGEQIGYDVAYDLVTDDNNKTYYAGTTTSWNAIDGLYQGFLGKLGGSFGWNSYVNVFGVQGDDYMRAIDNTYDEGTVAIGNLSHGASGGANVMIVKTDKDNTGGSVLILSEIVYDDITLSFDDQLTQTNQSLSVLPTITSDFITITGIEEAYNGQIVALNGQTISTFDSSNQILDLRNLSPGLYIIQVKTKTSTNAVKIIKR